MESRMERWLMPDRVARSEARVSPVFLPMAQMIPMPVTKTLPAIELFFLVLEDEVGHGADRSEYLASFLGIFDLDAVIFFEENDQFQCVDGIQSQAVAEQRCIGINIFRFYIFQV